MGHRCHWTHVTFTITVMDWSKGDYRRLRGSYPREGYRSCRKDLHGGRRKRTECTRCVYGVVTPESSGCLLSLARVGVGGTERVGRRTLSEAGVRWGKYEGPVL